MAQTADLSFEQLKTRYDTALVQIRTDSAIAYSNLLAGMLAAYQKKGELDGFQVVRDELKRVVSEKDMPTSEQKSVLAGKLGEPFVKGLGAMEQDRDKRTADLARMYIARLKGQMPALLAANRLDDAMKVKAEMEKAEFMLASAEAGLPKTATVDPAVKTKDKNPYPDDAVLYEGHHYIVVLDRVAWKEAKKACEAKGGHLIHIETPEEDEFVKGLCKMKSCWIGVTSENWANRRFEAKSKLATDFRLVNSVKQLQYKGWLDGRPDLSASADYVYMGVGYLGGNPKQMGWMDGVNADPSVAGYVCEWDK